MGTHHSLENKERSSQGNEKPSSAALVFLQYFQEFKEKQWPVPFVIFALRLYHSYHHAHAPG